MADKRFEILYTPMAAEHLAEVRAYERRTITETIDEQLAFQPTLETRHKKVLPGAVAPWEHVLPLRELRVGDYRVFYDVNDSAAIVTVRAVRQKLADKRTEDIL